MLNPVGRISTRRPYRGGGLKPALRESTSLSTTISVIKLAQGLEPWTSTLPRWRSTTELCQHSRRIDRDRDAKGGEYKSWQGNVNSSKLQPIPSTAEQLHADHRLPDHHRLLAESWNRRIYFKRPARAASAILRDEIKREIQLRLRRAALLRQMHLPCPQCRCELRQPIEQRDDRK